MGHLARMQTLPYLFKKAGYAPDRRCTGVLIPTLGLSQGRFLGGQELTYYSLSNSLLDWIVVRHLVVCAVSFHFFY